MILKTLKLLALASIAVIPMGCSHCRLNKGFKLEAAHVHAKADTLSEDKSYHLQRPPIKMVTGSLLEDDEETGDDDQCQLGLV